MKFCGKVVLVTGASRGLGRLFARAFAATGYAVAANYNNSTAAARELEREILAAGGVCAIFKADVSVSAQVEQLFAVVEEKLGAPSIVINNAAVSRDRAVLNMPEDDWDTVVETDLSGAFFVVRAAGRVLSRRRDGSVINISSVAGVRGNYGAANYSAAKGGLIALTKSAAKEFGAFGVRVNCVLPGFHPTDMGKSAGPEYERKTLSESVLGSPVSDEELAAFVVFLAEIKTVSGQVFNFDSRIM